MVPPCSDRISRVPPYSRINGGLPIRGYHPLRRDFPDASSYVPLITGLIPVRSPLLGESQLMSFPSGTKMFQFPEFASLAGYTVNCVGFPIRKSSDQSLLTAPRRLSQRATSFIASYRQGIHKMPLRHLISLVFIPVRPVRRPNGKTPG